MFEDASDFILDLADSFGATVDIETRDNNVYAIVWQDKNTSTLTAMKHNTNPHSWTVMLSIVLCCLAYLMATRGQAVMNDIKGVLIAYAMTDK